MSFKHLVTAALVSLLLLGLCGCSDSPDVPEIPSDLGLSLDTDNINREENIHIRDKDLLYANRDITEVVTMYLTVSTGNAAENTNHTWEEINTYSVFDYERMGVDRYKVAGLLQVGDANGLVAGELGYGQVAPNCTVQIRGQTSSKNTQKNYKISIKENKGDWRGQRTIALNKHQTDGLRFRNKLGFDLLADIEQLMSLRTTFVHLYVKDTTAGGSGTFEDYGIYTQVEQLNKTALQAHGLDKRGHLYKINVCEFYRYEDVIKPQDDPTFDLVEFEKILEVKGDTDHRKLIRLLEKINDYSISIDDILAEHFDIENMAYWMAFQILTGNIDTQNRNFYLYSPLNSERWYLLPWDLDGMLKRTEYDLQGRIDYQSWESGISNYWGNVLFQRCLKSDLYRTELDKAVDDLHNHLSADRIRSHVSAYSELLIPYLYAAGPDRVYAPLTREKYLTVCNGIAGEIDINYRLYKESLQKPMPFFIGVPTVKDGKLSLSWDPSYDFNGDTVRYTFELATDYTFAKPLLRQEGIVVPQIEFEIPPEGQYFLRIRAENGSGYTMDAFDYYVIPTGKVYGTKCFYIDRNGDVVEDVYVEG